MGKGDKLSKRREKFFAQCYLEEREKVEILENNLEYAQDTYKEQERLLNIELEDERGKYERLKDKKLKTLKTIVVENCKNCQSLLSRINEQIRENRRLEEDLERELSRQSYLPNPNCK